MPSKVSWWNDDRIIWYERAALLSSFHNELAAIIAPMLDGYSTIAEVGCGLGHLAEKLYSYNPTISAYDIDRNVIEKARKRTNLDIFHVGDGYNLTASFDVVIALFFGRITEDDNFQSLMRWAKKELIYITSKNLKHTSPAIIENFLNQHNAVFSKKEITLDFPQPLRDEDDIDSYLSSYYNGDSIDEKRARIKKVDNIDFPYLIENKKELTIFKIRRSK